MSVFRFKEFAVDQTGCAMKINTDGVLLGAMASVPIDKASQVLDIGTGTGVIALMMAQRYTAIEVTGVEVDDLSARRAAENARNTPFHERVRIVHRSFQEYTPAQALDLIVSNPPFYTNSLRNPDHRRGQAKHTDLQFFLDMLSFSRQFLATDGALELILPVTLAEELMLIATDYGLYTCRVVGISSFEHSDIIRKIVRFERRQPPAILESRFIIYEAQGQYSSMYKDALKPFFLAF